MNTINAIDYVKSKILLDFNRYDTKEISYYPYKGTVIIMMDDAWKSQYTVGYNYMKKLGMRGSIGVIPYFVGEPEYMNKADLYELYANDWDLLNHTYTHVNLKKSSIDVQKQEIGKADQWLEKQGFTKNSNILIYPYGEYNQDTIRMMNQFNIVAGRTTKEGFNPNAPTDLHKIKVKNVFSNIMPKEVYGWIDESIKSKLTTILLFHKLEKVTDESQMQYPEQYFYKIINYIDRRRKDLNVITYAEWLKLNIFYQNQGYKY